MPPAATSPSPHRHAWLLALLCAAAAVAGPAHAQQPAPTQAQAHDVPSHRALRILGDEEQERERLATIAAELAHLQALALRAAEVAPAGQRVRFRYDWLARDLQLMRDGIEQHSDAQRQPRPVPPLRGDYRQ